VCIDLVLLPAANRAEEEDTEEVEEEQAGAFVRKAGEEEGVELAKLVVVCGAICSSVM